MNTKIFVFVICVKAIIYLLLYNLHDCTFNKDIKNKRKLEDNHGHNITWAFHQTFTEEAQEGILNDFKEFDVPMCHNSFSSLFSQKPPS